LLILRSSLTSSLKKKVVGLKSHEEKKVLKRILTCLSLIILTGHSGYSSEDIERAIDHGHLKEVKRFLKANDSPNQVDSKGRSLLARAAYREQRDIAEAFLKAGYSVDYPDDQDNTPLYMACLQGNLDFIRLFLPLSENINYADNRGVTCLHIASQKGYEEVIKELCLFPDLQLNQQTLDGKTALWFACYKGHLSLVHYLLGKGALVNLADSHGISPLLISCFDGHTDIVRALLGHRANVNQVRDNGVSPLIAASYQGYEEIVRLLVEAGADLDYQSPPTLGGGTAYHYALQQDHQTISQYLHSFTAHRKSEEKDKELAQKLDLISNLADKIQFLSQKIERLEKQEESTKNSEDQRHPFSSRPSSALPNHLGHDMDDVLQKLNRLTCEIDRLSQEERVKADTLVTLKKQHEALWVVHRQEEAIENQKRYLRKENPNLKAFYETLERTLNQLFLAYKVLDTGMVERTKNSKLDKLSQGINLLGNVIPLPFASMVTTALSSGVSYAADRSAERHIRFIANLVRNTETIDRESEEAARVLTFTYENQIKNLTKKGTDMLAQCGVGRLIDYMNAAQVHDELGLSPQFISAVATFSSRQGWLGLRHQSLETQIPRNPSWTDKGLFQKTGILTEDDQQFVSNDHDDHKVYGFRKGTRSEAKQLGYRLLNR
jgi:ankyrin repeat protein